MRRLAPPHGIRSKRRGSLLIITLWMVTILSTLAIAIARYLSVEVRLTKHRLSREQAQALARSGVYLAMQRLTQDALEEPFDWLGDDWAAPGGALVTDPSAWLVHVDATDRGPVRFTGQVTIRMTDEERRLNVNTATAPVLAALLNPLGGSLELAQAIMDYADPDDEGLVEELRYFPKNAPVTALEELLEVPGVTPVFPALQPLVTAAPASTTPATVNINTAERAVLLALGADALVVEALIQARPGLDGAWGTDDDCKATDLANAATQLAACALQGDASPLVQLLSLSTATFVVGSSTFRVQVEAQLKEPRVGYRLEAIVRRTPEGSQVLAWREG